MSSSRTAIDDAADAVAVAVQVLGRAVHDEVGAELDRPLQARARERVVDDDLDAAPVRELGAAGDVGEPQHRVGRRLDEQHPRLGRIAASTASSCDVST